MRRHEINEEVMKPHQTQFATRRNTAPSGPLRENEPPEASFENPLDAARKPAATEGERRDDNHLLNVREVAELLRVPVSWVYGRMRKRSLGRIPAYRVGKYWRFEAKEVMAWLHETRWQSGPAQNA
jgi:excisionase family DNA binding protein